MSSLGKMKTIYMRDENDVIHLCQVHVCVEKMLENPKALSNVFRVNKIIL